MVSSDCPEKKKKKKRKKRKKEKEREPVLTEARDLLF
jgi:hypothetical protein